MDLNDMDLRVQDKEPLIGHINFNDVQLVEKGINHRIFKAKTFKGYPITVFFRDRQLQMLL